MDDKPDKPDTPGAAASGLSDQLSQAGQRLMRTDAARMVQEQIETHGPDLVERVKALAAEALVRRISIQHEGKTLFELPLAVGVGGALIVPQLAALGALAALLTNCTITVEREQS